MDLLGHMPARKGDGFSKDRIRSSMLNCHQIHSFPWFLPNTQLFLPADCWSCQWASNTSSKMATGGTLCTLLAAHLQQQNCAIKCTIVLGCWLIRFRFVPVSETESNFPSGIFRNFHHSYVNIPCNFQLFILTSASMLIFTLCYDSPSSTTFSDLLLRPPPQKIPLLGEALCQQHLLLFN